MASEIVDSRSSNMDENEPPPRTRFQSCLLYFVCVINWLFLYAATLSLLAAWISNRVWPGRPAEGYGAYISLAGFLVIMPIGLLLSGFVFLLWKRVWLFWTLAVVIAGVTAFAPIVLG